MAESSQNINEQHVGTDDRRFTSYGSTAAGPDEEGRAFRNDNMDTLDLIEADIDALKAEVSQIRKDTDEADNRSQHGQDVQSAEAVPHESAAARLQRAHDKLASMLCNREPEPRKVPPGPPTPDDFPLLGVAKTVFSENMMVADCSENDQSSSRRPSYARAAVAGWKGDTERRTSAKITKRPGADTFNGFSSASSSCHQDDGSQNQCTQSGELNFAAPVTASCINAELRSEGPTIGSKKSPARADSKPVKGSPRFAQPTQSFSRRTGDTVRKDTIPGTASEGSPTKKSVKVGVSNHESDKRTTQGHAKRRSLPGTWLKSDTTAEPEEITTLLSPTEKSSLASAASQLINHTHVKQTTRESQPQAAASAKSPKQIRKKTSSYMAPTAAATQRAIATKGQENVKHSTPRLKQGGLRVDTTDQLITTSSPDSNAVSARSSLPNSAVEREVSSAITSPATPASGRRGTLHFKSSPPVVVVDKALRAVGSLKSPSKIPRAVACQRVHRKTFSGSPLVQHGDRALSEALTKIANTTTRRRTSHADILQPIIAKLDNKGLWKNKPDSLHVSASVSDTSGHSDDSPRFCKSSVYRAPRKMSVAEQLEEVAVLTRQGVGIKRVMAPQLHDSRQSSVASTLTESTIIQVEPRMPMFVKDEDTSRVKLQDRRDSAAPLENPFEWAPLQQTPPGPAASLPSLLRATAQEFKPIWKPENIAQELRLLSWEGLLDEGTEQWRSSLPADVRVGLKSIQEWKKSASPTKAAERRFWGELAHRTAGSDIVPKPDEPVSLKDESFGAGHQPPNVVRAGQVLKPTLSPGKRSVHWIMQDINGEQKPISFGKTASSPALPGSKFESPILSPVSDDAMKAAIEPCGWNVSSTGMSRSGWLGGDGREIRFVGQGLIAEVDPNSRVNTPSYANANSVAYHKRHQGPRHGPTDRSDGFGSPVSKVWPRSRKQWAELAGWPKVPCGNIEYAQVAEVLPHPNVPATHCFDCVN